MRASADHRPAAAFTLRRPQPRYGGGGRARPPLREQESAAAVVAPFHLATRTHGHAALVDAHPARRTGPTPSTHISPNVPVPAPSTPAVVRRHADTGRRHAEGTGSAALPDSPWRYPRRRRCRRPLTGVPSDYCPDGVGARRTRARPADGRDGHAPARRRPARPPSPYFPECEPSDLAPGDLAVQASTRPRASGST